MGRTLCVTFGGGLVFELVDLPPCLFERARAFFIHSLGLPTDSASPPMRVVHGQPPPVSQCLCCAREEDLVTVRRAGHIVVLDGPACTAWCDSDRGIGGLVLEQEDPEEGADHLVTTILPALLNELAQARGWLAIHAAAVAYHGRAILLPGPSGSGKTTVYCGAARAGWPVLSDDSVWVHTADGGLEVVAFPRGVPIPTVPGPSADNVPLALVVTPTIVKRDVSLLVPIPAVEVLQALVAQIAVLGSSSRRVRCFDLLLQVARSVPGYRLEAGQDHAVVPGLLQEGLTKAHP